MEAVDLGAMNYPCDLNALGERLLACADDELLDTPLEVLRIDSDEPREMLRQIFEAGDARSLRELCSTAALETWCRKIATSREQRVLAAQFEIWLGRGRIGPDDPGRLAEVEPVPQRLEDLLEWARPHALSGELYRPAAEVLSDPDQILSPRTTLLDCCLGRIDARSSRASILASYRLEDDARSHLFREAAEHASLEARAALWDRPLPAESPVKSLVERLRAVVGKTDFSTLASVRFVAARRVSIDPNSGLSRAMVHGGAEGPFEAQLFLLGHEHRALEGLCARCAHPGCLHLRALAGRIVDAAMDERDRLHTTLNTFVARPSWSHFVRTVTARSADSTAEKRERLVFRIDLEGVDRGTVIVSSEKKLPSGVWSSGRIIAAHDAKRSSATQDRDRSVLDAITLASRTRTAKPVALDTMILRSLAEHPRVQLADRSPLRIREEIVHVELIEQPEGVVPRVTLAGIPIDPRERGSSRWLLHHDRESGVLSFAALTDPLRRLLEGLSTFRGVLPPESWPALAPWIESMRSVARVSAPNAMRGSERAASDRLLMRIEPGLDQGVIVALMVRALPLAPLYSPGQGPELIHGLEDGIQIFARRDLDHERAIAKRVTQQLQLERHIRRQPFSWAIDALQDSLALLSEAARLNDVLEIEWADRKPKLQITGSIGASDLSIELRQRGAWLTLDGGAKSGEADIAASRLMDAARRNQRFVPISGDDYVEIEEELFERLRQAQLCVTEGPKDDRKLALSLAAAPFFLDTLGELVRTGDESTRQWLERARTQSTVAIDPSWEPVLRAYQREGVEWLLDRARWAPGACLADEMGLGKTVQTIALLDARASAGPALVVAPTSVVGNWLTEVERFAPKLRLHSHFGANRETAVTAGAGDVIVTTYDILLRDRARFAEHTFATLVADEAQALKNARTKRARAVGQVRAEFRVALSGTPIENRLADLWSLFHLIAPGLLGSWSRFRSTFAVPIERGDDSERALALRHLIAPLVLRRTKVEVVKDLPSRTDIVHRVELSLAERDLYGAAVRDAKRALQRRAGDTNAPSIRMLAELTRLRQLACHPRLVIEDSRVSSSKLRALTNLLDDILPRGHRVLIFSQFVRHLSLVSEALDSRDIPYLMLDGSTPAKDRFQRVAAFQAGEAPVFLISLKAGGTGLNLTAADYVVHLDPWWNPSAEDQASDRAHRLGQDKPVTVVRLVSEGTIEEAVLRMHGDKRRLAQSIFQDAQAPVSLDSETLAALLLAPDHSNHHPD